MAKRYRKKTLHFYASRDLASTMSPRQIAYWTNKWKKGSKRARKRKWIKKAVNPKHKGYLHRALKVPAGKKIPLAKLKRAAKMSGVIGRRARFALNMRKFRNKKR